LTTGSISEPNSSAPVRWSELVPTPPMKPTGSRGYLTSGLRPVVVGSGDGSHGAPSGGPQNVVPRGVTTGVPGGEGGGDGPADKKSQRVLLWINQFEEFNF